MTAVDGRIILFAAGMLGIVLGLGASAMGYSIVRPKHVASDTAAALPPMHRIRITDSSSSVSVEHVQGWRIFQAGDCTVWRFTDSVGVHYLAEARERTESSPVAVSCSVTR